MYHFVCHSSGCDHSASTLCSVLRHGCTPSIFVDINGVCCHAAKFANLTTLNVGYTYMNGTFPADIVNCSKLVYINFSYTYITGGIPEDITNLQSLQVLDMTYICLKARL